MVDSIIDKLLVCLVLVTSIPLAYTRHTSLIGQRLLTNDVIEGRHHAYRSKHVEGLENPVDTQDNKSDIEIVDINGMTLGSQNEQYQVETQRDNDIVVVDMNGKILNSQNNQYQIQNQQEPETVIIDINGNVVNLDNDKYKVGNDVNDETVENLQNDYPEIQVTDVSGQVDLQNVKYEVQNQQYPNAHIVPFPKVGKIRDSFRNYIPNTGFEDDKENEIDSEINNNMLPGENFSENELETPYEVCQTAQCQKLADDFLSSVNKSVDPCENFYEFACGGWKSTNPKPSYRPDWSRFSMVEDSTELRIKAILETESDSDEILPERQAKKWYQSCMNTERLEQRGPEPFASIMKQVGGWPMIMKRGAWDEIEYTWQTVQNHYARLTGSYVFYDIDAGYSTESDGVGVISIDAPTLTDNNDVLSLILQKNANFYRSVIFQVARTFLKYNRASVPKERLLEEARELVSFEKALTKLIRKNAVEIFITLENLNDWYNSKKTDTDSGSPDSDVKWGSVIQDVFNHVNITVRPSTYIFIKNAGYVKGIGDLLKQTSSRTIVNYIHWTFLRKVSFTANKKIRDLLTDRIIWPLIGLSGEIPRWSECINDLNMKHAISYAFVKKYLSRKTAKSSKQMMENIRHALEEKIDNSNWMDSESKDLTKKKLNNMKFIVGFPEWYYNDTAIINHYKGIEIGSEYLENQLSYMRHVKKQNLTRYITPAPELLPFSTGEFPITVNAFYYPQANFAELTAAALQPPFFGIDNPNSVNYGIMGNSIGHEIGHAFDNCGITYGENGRNTKLNEMVLRSYYERVDCFVDQYDVYNGNPKIENGSKLNCENENDIRNKSDGQRTASENIADNTGLQAVFQAYKNWNKNNNPHGDMRLPGLEELTDNQLFFLSYAAMWCEVDTPKFKQFVNTMTDVHSSENLRVIGPISNTKGFAEAYNCPIGSPMNPVNKCSVWDKPSDKMNQTPRWKNRHSWHKQWNY